MSNSYPLFEIFSLFLLYSFLSLHLYKLSFFLSFFLSLSFSLIVHCFVSFPFLFFPSTVSFHLYTVTSFHFILLPPDVFISVSPNFLAFSSSYPSFFILLSFPSFPFFLFIYLSHRSHSLFHILLCCFFSIFFCRTVRYFTYEIWVGVQERGQSKGRHYKTMQLGTWTGVLCTVCLVAQW